MKAISWRDVAAAFVFVIGLLQMTGEITGSRLLKGIGAATAASPRPKVFCDINGLEPFASDFVLLLESDDGAVEQRKITPELYSRLRGPYNRRNAYGAALAAAPLLPAELRQAVFAFAFCENGPLRGELQIEPQFTRVEVEIKTKTAGRSGRWRFAPECARH